MKDNVLKPATRTVLNSRLTCAQCERMILDAMEDTLGPEDRTQFDLHLAGCPECSRAMADAQRGVAWLEMLQAAPPEPPGELVERILAQTSGDPVTALPLRPRNEPLLAYGNAIIPGGQGGLIPGAMAHFVPFQRPGTWFSRLVATVMQPRLAMTTAMAFFSIAITMNLTGVSLRDLHGSSLKPANVRHSFWAANARVVRYYENLRVVYEFESRVRELQRSTDDSGFIRRSAPAEPNATPDPVKDQPGDTQPSGNDQKQPGTNKPAPGNAAPGNGKSSSFPAPKAGSPRQSSLIKTAPLLAVVRESSLPGVPQSSQSQPAEIAEATILTPDSDYFSGNTAQLHQEGVHA